MAKRSRKFKFSSQRKQSKKLKKSLIPKKNKEIGLCPKCHKITKVPAKLDPYVQSFHKWYCDSCGIQWAENEPKGKCKLYGIVEKMQCKVCEHGKKSSARRMPCPYFEAQVFPEKWIKLAWQDS